MEAVRIHAFGKSSLELKLKLAWVLLIWEVGPCRIFCHHIWLEEGGGRDRWKSQIYLETQGVKWRGRTFFSWWLSHTNFLWSGKGESKRSEDFGTLSQNYIFYIFTTTGAVFLKINLNKWIDWKMRVGNSKFIDCAAGVH